MSRRQPANRPSKSRQEDDKSTRPGTFSQSTRAFLLVVGVALLLYAFLKVPGLGVHPRDMRQRIA